jgi:hypothetical protein
MNPSAPSRRQLLKLSASIAGAAALNPLVNGCTSSAASHSSPTAAGSQTLRDVVKGAQQVELSLAQSVNGIGEDVFTFGLLLKSGAFIEGGQPQVWLSRGQSTAVIGPFPATWHALTAYAGSGDHSPVTTLPGFYAARIQAPTAGQWLAAAVADSGQARAAGITTITVSNPTPAAVGSRALATPTPVASTPAGLAAICTREPPDPMHYISLDQALRSHQPTVACFATPLFVRKPNVRTRARRSARRLPHARTPSRVHPHRGIPATRLIPTRARFHRMGFPDRALDRAHRSTRHHPNPLRRTRHRQPTHGRPQTAALTGALRCFQTTGRHGDRRRTPDVPTDPQTRPEAIPSVLRQPARTAWARFAVVRHDVSDGGCERQVTASARIRGIVAPLGTRP